MRVDHCRVDVVVVEQFLDSTDVVAVLWTASIPRTRSGARQAGATGIAQDDLRVREAPVNDQGSGALDHALVRVEHPLGQQRNDPDRTTGQIERTPARLDRDPIKQPTSVLLVDLGLKPQSVQLGGATPQKVRGRVQGVTEWRAPRSLDNMVRPGRWRMDKKRSARFSVPVLLSGRTVRHAAPLCSRPSTPRRHAQVRQVRERGIVQRSVEPLAFLLGENSVGEVIRA
jgi:hypothetical protein